MSVALHVRRVGSGDPTLLLLHGLGANGDVWNPLLQGLGGWRGQILIPDLRGHGSSPHPGSYAEAEHADDVAALIMRAGDVYAVGHSMGGMIALSLGAAGRALPLRAIFAFGVKASWTEEEIEKAKAFAAKPARRFASRADAVERFLAASGLQGLVDKQSAVVNAGVVADGDCFRLAADPRTVTAGGGVLRDAFAGAKLISRLACGGQDPLVTVEQLRAIDPQAVMLGRCGHNPHVENPELLLASIPFLADDGDKRRTSFVSRPSKGLLERPE
jgi:pimeloyl-ACP methyl ester carboxylesterase